MYLASGRTKKRSPADDATPWTILSGWVHYYDELHSSNVYYHWQSCPHLGTPHKPLNPLFLLRKTGRRKFITTMNITYGASKLTASTTDTWVHVGLTPVCSALVPSTTVVKISFLLRSSVNGVVLYQSKSYFGCSDCSVAVVSQIIDLCFPYWVLPTFKPHRRGP